MNPNKKHIQLWIDALRSGKYKKGIHRLRKTGSSFCCLGVACEVAIKHGVKVEKRLNLNEGYYYYGEEYQFLPLSVAEWYGLPSQPKINISNLGQIDLTTINDEGINGELKNNFKEIADLIEKEFIK